jgi:hypothetical protein
VWAMIHYPYEIAVSDHSSKDGESASRAGLANPALSAENVAARAAPGPLGLANGCREALWMATESQWVSPPPGASAPFRLH